MRVQLVTLSTLALALALAQPAQTRDRAMPAAYGALFVESSAVESPGLPVLRSAPEASAYLSRVAEQEVAEGPFGANLAEYLDDAATYFESVGDLELALGLLKRATHVIRINEGLYSARQQVILDRMLDITLQLGQLQAADQLQEHRFFLARANAGPGDPEYIAALLSYVAWHRDRWLRDPDPEQPEPLYRLWRLLDNAWPEEEQSPLAYPQQAALSMAQLDLLYLVSVTDFGLDREEELLLGRAYAREQREPSVARSQVQYLQKVGYARGLALLESLSAQLTAKADPVRRASLALELADWHQWYGRSSRAEEQYRRAWRLLSGEEHRHLRDAWFGTPTELPAGGRLFPGARLAVIDPDEEPITARFDVSSRGRAENVDSGDFRINRWLRDTRFRPRVEDGEPVATAGLEREYRLLD